ncbi:feather keratin 1-like [Tyto alba]|uniref:feather keratin 1-like n=1 Tax=Tyto alba TaxID=56313 RepID=UPI001C667BC6|nr:feather keratin 1-like [Tyto alba]
MSCYNRCLPCVPCQPCGPTPLANSCNEPCVRQCQDSTIVIQPSPVVVTLPGPILSSFPQSTAVGSSTSAAVGSILSSEGVPISSGGFGLSGLGSRSRGASPAKSAGDGPGEGPRGPTRCYRTGDGALGSCSQSG